jgi:hypothetical protein
MTTSKKIEDHLKRNKWKNTSKKQNKMEDDLKKIEEKNGRRTNQPKLT